MTPTACAGCGQQLAASAAGFGAAEQRKQWLPLCQGCALRLARAGTERLSLFAASLVLGLSAASLLPLLFPWQSAGSLGVGVVTCCWLPFVLSPLMRRRIALPPALRPRLAWPWLASSLIGLLALLPLWDVYRGRVRVLNLTDEPFELLVDGHGVGTVEPSSGESTLAGVELELPAGERELRLLARGEGAEPRELSRTRVRVEGGKPHLFAPSSSDYCFQIERRGYGSAKTEAPDTEPLEGDARFWVLPTGITWFAPNPEPGWLETSGGTLASVRQQRCAP